MSLAGSSGDVFDPSDGVQPLEPREQAGLWQRILSPLAEAADPPVTAMIDWSSVKARRPAVGAKNGRLALGLDQSRGSWMTEVQMLADDAGNPRVVQIAPG